MFPLSYKFGKASGEPASGSSILKIWLVIMTVSVHHKENVSLPGKSYSGESSALTKQKGFRIDEAAACLIRFIIKRIVTERLEDVRMKS